MKKAGPAKITVNQIKKNLASELNTQPEDLANIESAGDCFQTRQLLELEDEEFVEKVYQVILRRKSDPHGKKNVLNKLQDNRISKEEVICRLRFSAEGRKQNVKLSGIYRALTKTIVYHIPLLSFVFKRGEFVNDGARQISKIKRQNLELKMRQEMSCGHWGKVTDALARRERELQERYINMDDRLKEFNIRLSEGQKQEEVIDRQLNYLNKVILEQSLSAEKKNSSLPKPVCESVVNENKSDCQNIVNSIYMAFEDTYRGNKAIVKQRLKVYQPWIKLNMKNRETAKCVDLGSGRGEWLQLQVESGLSVVGIDINPIAVSQCQAQGLTVICQDAIAYLQSLATDSLDMLSAFHLIEHLAYADFFDFIMQVIRVVKKGGLIILETPNPTNLLVSTYDFYRDPSHKNPIHPETLKFIFISLGCSKIEIKGLIHPETNTESEPSTFHEMDQSRLNCLDDYVNAPRDYCLLGIV